MTLLSVLTTYLLIVIGTAVMGFLVGQPPWPGEIILPGSVLIGAIAINVGVRSTGAPAKLTAVWTAGPIVVLYAFVLTTDWLESGRVALGSLFTSGALVTGLLLGWLLLCITHRHSG